MWNLPDDEISSFSVCGRSQLVLLGLGAQIEARTSLQVDRVMGTALRFFQQPEEVKRVASKGSFPQNRNHGWVSLEAER